MRFIEMGSASQPALLFLHGLAATAESCYGEVGRLLEKDWRVVLCELDGHYDGSPPFPGLEATCKQVEAFVTERCQGRLRGMVGLSLGGTIAVTILSRGNITIDKTVLDADFCVDMGLLRGFYNLIFPMGVGRIRDCKYVPGFVIDGLMGRGNRSVIEMLYPNIADATCRKACREIYAYHISEDLKRTASAVEFWRGSEEPYPKKSAALLKKLLPGMTERDFANMGHCQFLHERPREYAALLDAYMRGYEVIDSEDGRRCDHDPENHH